MKRRVKKRTEDVKRKKNKGYALAGFMIVIVGVIAVLGFLAMRNSTSQNTSQNATVTSFAIPSIPITNTIQGMATTNSFTVSCVSGKCYTCQQGSGQASSSGQTASSSCAVQCSNNQCTCSNGACVEISPPLNQ